MQKIDSVAGLKNAIQLLEAEHDESGRRLKEQFRITYESLRPVNLIKDTLDDIAKSPYLIDNLLGAVMGLVTGFYSNKLMLSTSGSKVKRLLGIALQFGVTNLVAKNQDTIKSVGQILVKVLTRKRRMNSQKP